MFFTTESVTEGHPDKFWDQVSDTVLAFIRPYKNVIDYEALLYHRFGLGKYLLLSEVYELDDYKMPSDEVVKRLQATIDEAFGRSGSWFTRYRLSPFLVGWNESYLQESKPSSKEFAEIYKQYVNEGGVEKIFSPRPGSQGTISYRGSLKPE